MIDQYLSPAERKRLVSALMVVLGFIALLAMFGFLVLPGLRYQAVPDRNLGGGSQVQPVLGETGWLDPTDYPPARKRVIPPIDPRTVMTATPALLARGRELYLQECVSCHGPEGKGDGPGGSALNPRPRNFTVKDGWKNNFHIDGLYKTLEEGIPGSGMVSFNYLSRKDRMALVHQVQSLGAFDHGGGNPAATEALEHLFASSGEVIPNRIPVRMAVAILCREYAATHPPKP